MSKRTEKRVPELRFKGFTDDWEQKKLSEIVNVNSGRDYKHLEAGEIPVFGTGGYMLSVNVSLSNKDAIGIGRKGTINRPYFLKSPFWTVDTLFYVTPKNYIDIYFLLHNFSKIPWNKYDESTGVPSLSKSTINNIKISIPKLSEQIKIGEILEQLNQLITLYQRKLDRLSSLKASLNCYLLPTKNRKIPLLQFDESSDWKHTILGDYLVPAKKEETIITSAEQLLTVKLNLKGIVIGSNRETLSLTETKYYIRNEGQLLYGKQNFFNGSIGVVSASQDGFATSADVPALDINNINTDFLLNYIGRSNYYKEKEKFSSGTGSKRIHENTLLDFEISVPNLNVQTSISKIFTELDCLINQHFSKLENLNSLKNFFLNRLFV